MALQFETRISLPLSTKSTARKNQIQDFLESVNTRLRIILPI